MCVCEGGERRADAIQLTTQTMNSCKQHVIVLIFSKYCAVVWSCRAAGFSMWTTALKTVSEVLRRWKGLKDTWRKEKQRQGIVKERTRTRTKKYVHRHDNTAEMNSRDITSFFFSLSPSAPFISPALFLPPSVGFCLWPYVTNTSSPLEGGSREVDEHGYMSSNITFILGP